MLSSLFTPAIRKDRLPTIPGFQLRHQSLPPSKVGEIRVLPYVHQTLQRSSWFGLEDSAKVAYSSHKGGGASHDD